MFECFNCGKCCKNIVFHNIERRLALKYCYNNDINSAAFRQSLDYRSSVTMRDHYYLEGKCPFNKNNKCEIYEVRPLNCRRFMCGRLLETEEVKWQGNRCLNTELHYNVDNEFKQQVDENAKEIKKWALKEGII